MKGLGKRRMAFKRGSSSTGLPENVWPPSVHGMSGNVPGLWPFSYTAARAAHCDFEASESCSGWPSRFFTSFLIASAAPQISFSKASLGGSCKRT